jgi:hypothetical protein
MRKFAIVRKIDDAGLAIKLGEVAQRTIPGNP